MPGHSQDFAVGRMQFFDMIIPNFFLYLERGIGIFSSMPDDLAKILQIYIVLYSCMFIILSMPKLIGSNLEEICYMPNP